MFFDGLQNLKKESSNWSKILFSKTESISSIDE